MTAKEKLLDAAHLALRELRQFYDDHESEAIRILNDAIAAQNKEDYESAVKYLKDVYGLEPNDVELSESDTIKDVERIAEKYGLTKLEDMTLEKAVRILKPFRRGA